MEQKFVKEFTRFCIRGNRDWRQGQVGVGSQHCARQGVFTFSWDLTTGVSTAYFPRLLQTSFHRRLKTITSTSCLKISERPPLWGNVLHPFPAAYPTTSPTPRAGASNVSALSPSQAITPHHGIGSAVWWAGPLPLGLWIWLISIKTHGSLFRAWWASVPGYPRPAGVEKEGSEVLTCKWSRFNVKSSIEELLFLAASSWLQMHAHTLENLTSASSLPTLGPCTCAYPRSPHRGVSTRSPYRCWVVVSSPFTEGVKWLTLHHTVLEGLRCRTVASIWVHIVWELRGGETEVCVPESTTSQDKDVQRCQSLVCTSLSCENRCSVQGREVATSSWGAVSLHSRHIGAAIGKRWQCLISLRGEKDSSECGLQRKRLQVYELRRHSWSSALWETEP